MFDFTKYYKNMSASTDANIDLSNLPIKSDSSKTTLDDNGTATEVVLNEIVTKNIDYVVTEVNGTIPDMCSGGKYDISDGRRITNVTLDVQTDDEEKDVFSFRRYSSLDDADHLVIAKDGSEVSSVPFSLTKDGVAYSGTLSVTPKYKLLSHTLPYATTDNQYAHILGMFGLLGSGCETLKWAMSSSRYKEKNCVLKYSTLMDRLEKINTRLAGTGYEVEATTYYELPAPDDTSENPVDIAKPDAGTVASKMNSTFVINYGNTQGFCNRMISYTYMPDCDGDNSTPFLPSIRDAFEAYYYSKQDLEDTFNDEFNEVIYQIKQLWRFKSFLKKSTLTKLNKIFKEEYVYANADELSYANTSNNNNHQWLVDLDTMLCIDDDSSAPVYPSLVSPFYSVNCFRLQPTFFVEGIDHKFSFAPQEFTKDGVSANNALFSYREMSILEVYDSICSLYDNNIAPTLGYTDQEYRRSFIVQALNIVLDSVYVPLVWSTSTYVEPFHLGYYQSDLELETALGGDAFKDLRVRVINWEEGAEVDDEGICQGTGQDELDPELMPTTSAADAFIYEKIDIVDDIDDILSIFDTAITVMALTIAKSAAAVLKLYLTNLNRAVDNFNVTLKRIKYFEYYTGDSVFETKERLLPDYNCYQISNHKPVTITIPARFLVPTKVYKNRKLKGIYWTEIKFINTNLYERYPKNEEVPSEHIDFKSTITVSGDTGVTADELPSEIDLFDEITIVAEDGTKFSATLSDRTHVNLVGKYTAGTYVTTYIEKGLSNTKNTDARSNITVEYKIPHLPYDDELKMYAINEYGPFEQTINAEIERGGQVTNKYDGWQIFYDSSTELKDLRKGINIYPTVAHLLRILYDTYGSNRIQLCDTMRSYKDQKAICLGGDDSAFLSWHNYGLAVKILIYKEDCVSLIDTTGDDMKKLVSIAETFTDDAWKGKYGASFNVVWCGRLKTGADIFDWEFLPIGVEHKDAYKFRDSVILQRDPIIDCSYVNARQYLVSTNPGKSATNPWITADNQAYKNGIQVNSGVYVSPKAIRNFPFQKNLVLINLIEFFKLIRLKMNAYGTKLPETDDMYAWMSKNKASYRQLLVYLGITGNTKSAQSLLSGEYAMKYNPVLDTYYNTDAIEFVKNYLGSFYDDVKIIMEDSKDASYISLKDGKLHIPCMDGRPNLPLSAENLFDQQQVTIDNYERGVWKDGIFVPATDDMEYVSESSVLNGYVDGAPVGGDAYLIHSIIADQIKAELETIVKQFESYNGYLLFDSYSNGPNANKFEQLENEFGLIASQDVLPFDKLSSILSSKDIPMTEDNDLYEKVVSNAQVAGMRLASLSSEHVEVNDPVDEGLTIETFTKLFDNGNAPTANDMMKSR